MQDERPRLPSAEAAVCADLLFERGDLARRAIVLTDDDQVAAVRHFVESLQSCGGVRSEDLDRVYAFDTPLVEVVNAARAAHQSTCDLRPDHDEPDARVTDQPVDESRMIHLDRLHRDASTHARKGDQREVPGRGYDQVVEVGIRRSPSPPTKGVVREPADQSRPSYCLREEGCKPAPILDVCGRRPHRHTLTDQLVEHISERLTVALAKRGAGALAMIR